MFIRCWGARGSIPVSGREYVRYGGATTCVEIRTAEDAVLIVDAGTGIRRLGNLLLEEGRTHCTLLFTHAHWDHLMGFPFFKPIYRSNFSLDVYGCPLENGSMQHLLGGLMSPPYFPVPLTQIRADVTWRKICTQAPPQRIGGLEVHAIALDHPNQGLGFKFVEQGKSFVFLTDNELGGGHPGGRSFDGYVEFCRGADLLMHDAEFTDAEYAYTRGWGHSTWRAALELALEAQVRQFGLFHHNQDRTDDALDDIIAQCREVIASVGRDMHCFAVRQGGGMELL